MDCVLSLLNVPCVQRQCLLVCHTLLQHIAKIRKGIRKSFASLLVNLPSFAKLSHLVAVRQGVCCSYL